MFFIKLQSSSSCIFTLLFVFISSTISYSTLLIVHLTSKNKFATIVYTRAANYEQEDDNQMVFLLKHRQSLNQHVNHIFGFPFEKEKK